MLTWATNQAKLWFSRKVYFEQVQVAQIFFTNIWSLSVCWLQIWVTHSSFVCWRLNLAITEFELQASYSPSLGHCNVLQTLPACPLNFNRPVLTLPDCKSTPKACPVSWIFINQSSIVLMYLLGVCINMKYEMDSGTGCVAFTVYRLLCIPDSGLLGLLWISFWQKDTSLLLWADVNAGQVGPDFTFDTADNWLDWTLRVRRLPC